MCAPALLQASTTGPPPIHHWVRDHFSPHSSLFRGMEKANTAPNGVGPTRQQQAASSKQNRLLSSETTSVRDFSSLTFGALVSFPFALLQRSSASRTKSLLQDLESNLPEIWLCTVHTNADTRPEMSVVLLLLLLLPPPAVPAPV